MVRLIQIAVLKLLLATIAIAQNTIGLPEIINYKKATYNAGAQNRQIKQDKNGILYFANNEGVMSFDGINWRLYPLPNKSIVRSIEFGPDGNLYAGGQDEFGYFTPNKNGLLHYQSLKQILPKNEQAFTDVWKIIPYQGGVLFQTDSKIYHVKGTNSMVYKSNNWRFFGSCNGMLIAQDAEKGVLFLQDGRWVPLLTKNSLPADALITSSYQITHDSALLTTRKHGLYIISAKTLSKLQSPFLNEISNQHISGATPVNEDHIAIVTNLSGCFIIDKKGNLVQSFSAREGLQNNNILDVFLDREKNIWLGLDNGIGFVAYNNAIKHIYPEYLNEGSGYASIIHNNYLYIGTSNGLYRVPIDNNTDLSFTKGYFELVGNTKGQVWNLSVVNSQLLLGHHDGGFLVKKNKATLIDNSSGFWNFFPLPSSEIISGTYNGINFYDVKEGKLNNKKVSAQFESARFVVIDNNFIWASHPYKGVFKIQSGTYKPLIKQYSKKEGVASVNDNYIFKIKNRLLLTTENGIKEYNYTKDVFQPSSYYNSIFGNKKIRYLKEDNAGNVWFVFDKTLGVVDFNGSKHQIIYLPELTNKMVSGFEHVYPVDRNNVFIGGENGFYHINYQLYKQTKYPLQVQIQLVKAMGKSDSLLFGGYVERVNVMKTPAEPESVSINYAWNSIHFEYASPSFAQQSTIEYTFFLEGFDKKWSEPSKKTEKEYTNLPPGDYVFRVKAHNNLGSESSASSFTFSVLPPWYYSYWAYLLYAIAAISLIYLLYMKQKSKFIKQRIQFEEEQKRLQYLHQLEIEKNKMEIIQLRNEKLEAEIQHKNTELASTAMHLMQKGELLTKLKEDITRMVKQPNQHPSVYDFKKIIKALKEEEKVNNDWDHFSKHFDNVHSNFLVALKERYPILTPNELKVCAYLRMNLSSKEIAQLMNISVRGVEISRYRLRKKLQIHRDVNLFDHLIQIHPILEN